MKPPDARREPSDSFNEPVPPDTCEQCHEKRQASDPGLSPSLLGWTCAFCGYWDIPTGPKRDSIRAKRNTPKAVVP